MTNAPHAIHFDKDKKLDESRLINTMIKDGSISHTQAKKLKHELENELDGDDYMVVGGDDNPDGRLPKSQGLCTNRLIILLVITTICSCSLLLPTEAGELLVQRSARAPVISRAPHGRGCNGW